MADMAMIGIPAALGAIALVLAIAGHIYTKRRRVFWDAILTESIAYHRHHLEAGLARGEFTGRREERAREFLRVVTQQYPRERTRYRGLRDLPVMRLGVKSTLVSLDELLFRIFREDPWGSCHRDDVLKKLIRTFQSTVYRSLFMHSLLGLPAILYMDGRLGAARLGIARSGSARLYRDIADDLRR
ncbi:MAG TPA: hypothetical protein PKJ16_01365 [Spirochaetota bacterium]|nr:hypothetical protein [Spirochaetota bacterium]HOS39032.1 hypothetical protein [Spirochaetota bacterium]HPU88043.1 hypothetical protein [Spirochaetota bacterium]